MLLRLLGTLYVLGGLFLGSRASYLRDGLTILLSAFVLASGTILLALSEWWMSSERKEN